MLFQIHCLKWILILFLNKDGNKSALTILILFVCRKNLYSCRKTSVYGHNSWYSSDSANSHIIRKVSIRHLFYNWTDHKKIYRRKIGFLCLWHCLSMITFCRMIRSVQLWKRCSTSRPFESRVTFCLIYRAFVGHIAWTKSYDLKPVRV